MTTVASKSKLFFLETRPQFLTLTPVCFSVGVAVAAYQGYLNGLHLVLALIGAVLAHVSVNVLNDYVDFKRGTDLLTQRTPFSGGSGMLPTGALGPREALALGVGSLVAGLLIGAYFVYVYPALIIIIALAALVIYAYTPVLTKIGITELFPGLGFGPLLIIGTYITQLPPDNVSVPLVVVLASIPAGILVSDLLFVNEIPDYEADLKTGRKHAVLLMGRKTASYGYVVLLALAYVAIIVPVVLGVLPPHVLLGLLTLPIAIRASQGVLANYNDTEKLVPALGQNVLVVLGTPALMTIGLVIAALTR